MTKISFPEVAFGTYRLKHEVLEIACGQAVKAMEAIAGIGSPLVDTAVSYNNSSVIQRIIQQFPHVRVGTKLRRKNLTALQQDLQSEKERYGNHLYRALLHRHMPIQAYLILVQAKADCVVQEIGVSNYTAQQLRDLCEALQDLHQQGKLPASMTLEQAMPDICQNEFHPFLQTTVSAACQELGIRFEAHSVHTGLENYPESVIRESGQTVGQISMAYARQRGNGSIVFNSANYHHVLENLQAAPLTEDVLQQLDQLKKYKTLARYAGSESARFVVPINGGLSIDTGFLQLSHEYIQTVIAPQIRQDQATLRNGDDEPSNYALAIPRVDFREPASVEAHLVLARAVFVDNKTGETAVFFKGEPDKQRYALIQKLKSLLRTLRRTIDERRKRERLQAKPKMCKLHAIENPEALPVDIPDKTVVQPLIDLVANATSLPDTAILLKRGVLFPDGRLDNCKQVAQPAFAELCNAVLQSNVVKHFLIGNNLALANDVTGEAERALVNLILESKGIETFYLAGNAISEMQIKSIAEAFAQSKDTRYVWLKMNPIKTGSFYLGRMLHLNPRIEVLDLFNTGQCDEGVQAFLNGYDSVSNDDVTAPSGLKHLYLDINAITDGALVAKVVSRFPSLESLFCNVNQIGDSGMSELCDGILGMETPPPLERLVVGSNGCTDAALIKLTSLVQALPSLTIVQLGSYRSTKFFQQSPNQFSSFNGMMELATAVAANAAMKGRQGFFGFQNAFTDVERATALTDAIETLGLQVNGIQGHGKGYAAATSKEMEQLGIQVQPAPVEYIQSVYRNAM